MIREIYLCFIQNEQWDAMSEEDQVEAMNDLWRNFCVSDAYEPGSTGRNRLLWRPAWKQEI